MPYQIDMKYENLAETDFYGYQAFHYGMREYGLSIPIGSKVETTEWARQNGISKKSLTGKLVGHSRDGKCLRIIPDGIKSVYTYWPGFWKLK